MILEKVGYGYCDGVVEATVLCSVFWFFGADIATIDGVQNMGDEKFTIGLRFTDFVFFKINMCNAFVREG